MPARVARRPGQHQADVIQAYEEKLSKTKHFSQARVKGNVGETNKTPGGDGKRILG